MIYYWTDEDGGIGTLPWAYVNPGVADADWGLDAIYTQEGSTGVIFASFVADDDDLNVWRRRAGINDVHDFGALVSDNEPSISAFLSNAFIAFRSGAAILYRVTYNMGDSWATGTIESSGLNFEPRVTLRHGGGIVVTYEQDTTPDDILYMRRRSYPFGAWTSVMRCTDDDIAWNWPASLAYLKEGGYGVLTVTSLGGTQYDETPLLFFGDFDLGNTSGWTAVVPH